MPAMFAHFSLPISGAYQTDRNRGKAINPRIPDPYLAFPAYPPDLLAAQPKTDTIRVMGDVEIPARFEPVPVAAVLPDQASVEPPPFLVLSSSWQGEIELEWDDEEGVDEHRMLILLNYAGTTVGLGALRAEVSGEYGRFIALPV